MNEENKVIRCSYSKKYKATKEPTCGCEKCKTKWAHSWMVKQIVGRYNVGESTKRVADDVVGRLKKTAQPWEIEAVRELAIMYHQENIDLYNRVMRAEGCKASCWL